MFDAAQQLQHVRRFGRLLLLIQQLSLAVMVVVIVFVSCGLLDYLLRFPGWLRLGLGLGVVVTVGLWWWGRLVSVLRFRPSLSTLALRFERLYPQLEGVFASSIELSAVAGDAGRSDASATMARQSVTAAEKRLAGLSVWRLIDSRSTARSVAVALGFVAVSAVILWTGPSMSRLALARWFDPLGPAQWPNRTRVASLMTTLTWPSDAPVRFRARVERGYYPGMRTWVVYRLVDAAGTDAPWQWLLSSEQAQDEAHRGVRAAATASRNEDAAIEQGVFERLVDLTPHDLGSDPSALPTVEFFFQAGDDRTATQELMLVARPAVRSVMAMIEPPAYAHGLVDPQRIAMDRQEGLVVSVRAVVGSTVNLTIAFNKPVQAPPGGWDSLLPGLIGYGAAAAGPMLPDGTAMIARKSFVLREQIESPIRVTDQYGFGNLSDRLYRFTVVSDYPPTVSMVEPAGDGAVLPTAVVETESVAQDDLGLSGLKVLASVVHGGGSSPSTDTKSQHTLVDKQGRQPRLFVRHRLDLEPLGLKPGDEVMLTAEASDVFELDGRRHDPVRSTPRTLRVVDAATLIGQVRTELAAIRQQAMRIESQQREGMDWPDADAPKQQKRLTVHLEAQTAQVASVKQLVRRNRLTADQAGQLHRLLDRASELSQQAERSSRRAAELMAQPSAGSDRPEGDRSRGRQAQQKVSAWLTQLIDLLDQGRDALALHARLQQLKTLQSALTQETQHLMPVTVGWKLDQLSKPERQALAQLTDRQAGLSQLADTLLRRMQSTSDALSRQGDQTEDQATAQVLAEAASIARRQGLVRTLDQAAEKTRTNRLSDAGNDQRLALDVVDRMLSELANVDQRHQTILERRLVELSEAVRKLIDRQAGLLERFEQIDEVTALDAPLSALRRNTMTVAQRAAASEQTEEAGRSLDSAVSEQSAAIRALRNAERPAAATGQSQALVHLKRALALIEEQRDQAQADRLMKKRQELRRAYEQLADQQDTLREETVPLAGQDVLSRRQRAQLANLGHREADLKIAARQLRSKVEQTLMFIYLHDQIDEHTAMIVSRLRKAQPDQTVLEKQQQVAVMLRQMAGVLAVEPDDSEFAGRRGAGGAGGGGSGDQVVPPLAELKLLRAVQQQINQRTRQLGRQAQGDVAGGLTSLSRQQRQLAVLGRRLIRLLNQPDERPHQPAR